MAIIYSIHPQRGPRGVRVWLNIGEPHVMFGRIITVFSDRDERGYRARLHIQRGPTDLEMLMAKAFQWRSSLGVVRLLSTRLSDNAIPQAFLLDFPQSISAIKAG